MLLGQLSEIPLFPEAASTLAGEVDALFLFVLGVTLFFTLLIALMIFVFMIRYRRRKVGEVPPRIEGSLKLELFWTFVPLGIVLLIFVWGARVYMKWADAPADSLPIYVVGRQWMWHVQHAGGQREINRLHIPVGQPVKLTMTSQDVIHSFYVPAFRAHMDAIPGRYTTLWFQATKVGRYHLFCSEFCGTNHSSMIGEVVVLSAKDYETWLKEGADTSLATRGRQQFLKLQCIACHSADSRARAPVLENLWLRRVPLHDGRTIVADEAYLRESIRAPDAKIVAGFQSPSIMPAYGPDLVDEDALIELLAFVRSLGPGQTPPRVEQAAPPTVRGEAPKTNPPAKGGKAR